MSYIGRNIKKIRTVKKLSQSAFADIFNITRASVGAYEEGRAEPKLDIIIEIAKYFSISVESFISKELTVNEIYNFDIFKDEIQNSVNKPVKKKDENAIPYITQHYLMDYTTHFEDFEFIDNLPTLKIPFKWKGITRAFECWKNDMHFFENGIRQNDILLCKRIEKDDWGKIEINKLYIIINKTNPVFGRFTEKSTTLLFRPDNPNFENTYIQLDEISEIWELKGVYSTYIRQPLPIEERLIRLENRFENFLNKT
jgi:transcriptional regulator with XRE-family HTH domain